MVDKAEIADAIKTNPREAADALLAVQSGSRTPVTWQVLAAVAQLKQRETESEAVDEIERLGLLDTFALALKARGIPIDTQEVDAGATNFNLTLLQQFLPHAESFRCRVFLDRQFSGSGCLISPSLVLTAWHVIAAAAPGTTAPPRLPIEVRLSDGTKRRVRAKPIYASETTELEFQGQFPSANGAFNGRNDIALIKLERPDGVRLGFPVLPRQAPKIPSGSSIAVLHFPEGEEKGIGFGKVTKIRSVKARWQHNADLASGSSGGPCFNTRLDLIGLHQGRFPPNRRLVPIDCFLDDIRPEIEKDVAPTILWSLDGTPQGSLVIGRDFFFEAVAAAAQPSSRVRGVRVKRHDMSQGTTGLTYSLEMLKLALARNPGVHRIVRINFEPPYGDLIEDIRRRAGFQGVNVPPIAAGPGAGHRETTLEATINDRARDLVTQLNIVAESSAQLLWFAFENPPVGLTDTERFAFEAFVGAALRQPRLRLMLSGCETVTTPGEAFDRPPTDDSDGAPCLLVEYFGLFRRQDVQLLLTRASKDFGLEPNAGEIAGRVDQILQGLNAINGQYSTRDILVVSDRAVPHLEFFRTKAEEQP